MEAVGGSWGRTDPPLGWCLPMDLPAIQTRVNKRLFGMEKETRAQLEEEPFIDKSTNGEKVSGFRTRRNIVVAGYHY
jgi:hypothetical protein